jgi:hypothetical protein
LPVAHTPSRGIPDSKAFSCSPVKGEDRYFVVTTWSTEGRPELAEGNAGKHHGGDHSAVATGADLLEFETVTLCLTLNSLMAGHPAMNGCHQCSKGKEPCLVSLRLSCTGEFRVD